MASKQRKPRCKLADWHLPVVYYVQDNASKLIKIGTTTNAWKRFVSLRSQSPADLTILGFEKGGTQHEKRLHRHFDRYHHHREWFNPAPAILNRIERFGFKQLQPLLDRMTHADYQEVIDHLETKARRLHRLIDEYKRRQRGSTKRGAVQSGYFGDPDRWINEPAGIMVHTYKESMAWRSEWKDRLYLAAEVNTSESWSDFTCWYGAGIFTSIVGRIECTEDIHSITWFVDRLRSRWVVRHFAWCRRANVTPQAAEILLAPMDVAFGHVQDLIIRLSRKGDGRSFLDSLMVSLYGSEVRPPDLFAAILSRSCPDEGVDRILATGFAEIGAADDRACD